MASSRKNILTLMSGTMLAQALPVAVSPILSRLFSPEDFGVLALYVAVTGILGAVANGRYELAIMLPQDDEEARTVVILGLLIALCVSLSLLVGVVISGEWIAGKLGQPGETWWLYFAPLSVLLIGLFNMLNYYNNRQKSYKKMSVAHVSRAGVTASSQLASGSMKIGAPGLIFGRIAGEVVAVSLLLFGVGGKKIFSDMRGQKIWAVAKRYQDFPKFSMWSILFNRSGIHAVEFFISAVYSLGLLGQYSLMQRVLVAPSALVGSAIGQVFFQEASEEKKKTGKAIKSFNKTFLLLGIVSVSGYGVLYFIAEPLFAIVFGEQWRVAGELTKLLIPFFMLQFVAAAMSLINSVFEKQKIAFYWQIGFLVLYLMILIFTYWSGGSVQFLLTAISTVISIYFGVWIFLMFLISRGRL